ncbi:hypothetical protein M2302_002225 [Micromonospora sp. A200]|uniref:hypothetical protein n=1 Tax=Micromonospora sp. A200 TaxID=2940568 RepID=UPI002473DE2C|nr:hypothetical protein [Micromonospora sp. A200]MDH6462050.1 hypothetical protein [Micromonospora sp. A200]
MTITSYPFDNIDTTESDYSRLFRELQDSGVADTHGGSGFQVSGNASGMQVFVQPGFALVRGHAIYSTAVETVTLSPASAATRIDRIVLRLDPAQNGITIVPVEGVPGGSAPALIQTDTEVYELPLAQITVANGVASIASTAVTDDRRFLGNRVRAWSTDTRPSSPRKALLGLNTTTGKWEYHTGSGWSDLIPSVVETSTKWNGYTLTVSSTTPSGTPTADRIWIQPVG